jgi:ribonuclease-3 family protein
MDGSTNISEDLLEGESTVEQIQPLLNTLARKIEAVPIPVLAYVGDAVFEVFARLHSMYTNEWNMNTLHRASVRLVKAESQAELLRLLEPYLSEEEKNMVRRGRNAKSGQIPKGVSAPLYRYSTAFETLMGYLYLTDRSSRIEELLKLAGLSRSRV